MAEAGEVDEELAAGPVVWRRHPSDVAQLVAATLGALALAVLAALFPQALTNLSDDIVDLFTRMPVTLRDVIGGLAQILVFAVPVLALALGAWRREWRVLATSLACAVAAGLVMSQLIDWLERVAPPTASANARPDSLLFGADFPSTSYVAALAAGVVALTPLLSRRWQHAAWWGVLGAAVLRLASAAVVPVNVGMAVAVGVAVGSAVLVAVGAPARLVTPAAVRRVLERLGHDVGGVERRVGGATRAFDATIDGRPAFVRWIGRDERDADLLYRAWRALRVRGVDEEPLGVSPRLRVRSEALATMLAGEHGVDAPSVIAVGQDDEAAVLALGHLDGTPLAELDEGAVTDRVLEAAWGQVAALHAANIRHGSLWGEHVLLRDDGGVALTGLTRAQVGATVEDRRADLAELLVDSALRVGPERAVRAAMTAIGPDELEATLPLLQPLALSSPTRRRLRHRKEVVDEVRSGLAERLGVDDVRLEPVERIGIGSLVTFAGFLFLLWFGLQVIAGWDEIVDALSGADWDYLPVIMLLTALTYAAGAVGLAGAVVRRLPVLPTTVVMVGQSFLNRFTPANAGGMAMRVRYLQKGGSETERAIMSIGLTSLAVPITQVPLFLVFGLWAGSDRAPEADYSLPDPTTLALWLLLACGVVGGLLTFGRLRTIAVDWVRRTWGKVSTQLRELSSRPTKMALLFGGTAGNKILVILAFVVSCRALSIDLGFAQLGLLYLVGSTIGAAVPTPGGLGGVEAALIAALTGAGVAAAPATAAVLLFRLVTYWMPVPFGYVALRYCRYAELV